MKVATMVITVLLCAGALSGQQTVDQNGKTHVWKGPSGRYTVLDFAASWCRPCWKVLPKLQAFAGDHPGVRVLVVSVDNDQHGRDALVERLKLTVPVIWDETHEIAHHFEPGGMPATFVLDPDGKIVYQHVGSSEDDWKALVRFIDDVAR